MTFLQRPQTYSKLAKDSFSFDISMQSGFWFESLNSTASATAPSTRQENEIDMPPHDLHGKQSTQGNYTVRAKIMTQVLCGQQGAFLVLTVPPSVYFPLQQHLVSFIWGFYNESAHSCGSIYCTKAEPTVSTKRHSIPDWWNCWNTQLSLTHNLLQARA